MVQRPVERDVIEIEPNDPVERAQRFVLERVEHTSIDPLVAFADRGGHCPLTRLPRPVLRGGLVLARRTATIAVFMLAGSMVGVVASPSVAQVAPASGVTIERPADPIPGQYIVTLKQPVADVSDQAESLAGSHDAKVVETYSHALSGFAARMSEEDAVALSQDPAVAAVEQDGYMHGTATQTPATWGLDRIDQRDRPLDSSYSYQANGRRVTVYVVDTGIMTGHADFQGRASVGIDEVGDGRNGQDCNGHGTHVAGTIGGATYGVAKDAALVAVRVLNCQGTGSFAQVIAGVDWITANHAPVSVANMSLASASISLAVDTAVQNSIASGVTYAVAAGNEGGNACFTSPGRVPEALTVGATDQSDTRASFSDVGSCLDLFAPGVGITSDWIGSDHATFVAAGTSMAAPHVAGAAALFLQANPGATPAQVAATLVANATPNRVTNAGAGSPNVLLYQGFIPAPPPYAVPLQRIFGQDAIGTSLAVSQTQFPVAKSASAVVLARSDFFADALAGGPLAAANNAALLITPGAGLSPDLDPRVLTEIERVLAPNATVYILGGTLALAPGIDIALQNAGYQTQRVQGATQFSTAVAVANALGDPATIFEATGLNFADALSAVPAAIQNGGAILLTNGNTQAPETAAYLASHSGTKRYAIGGPLAAAGADPLATAIYGQDLYDTSAAVASTFFPAATTVSGATGVDFPDALSGGVFMGVPSHAGPVLLFRPSLPIPTSIAQYLDRNVFIAHNILFGGPLAVQDDVANAMAFISGSGIT